MIFCCKKKEQNKVLFLIYFIGESLKLAILKTKNRKILINFYYKIKL